MIKAIAFDYGGVIEMSEGDVINEIIECLKITQEIWKQKYFEFVNLSNSGEKSWEDVVILTCLELGASSKQISEINSIMLNHEKTKYLNSDLIELIAVLKRKFRIALVSNYTSSLRQRLVRQNIMSLFDTIIISGEVGYQKPDPNIFYKLIESLNVKSNELIFIDDSNKSLANAKEIGYFPILFLNNDQLKHDLKSLIKI
jgi:HAD superfamily hydrolase (TIGR01509 family)